ncbi:MAG TPA: LptF/LptG family permease [Chryseolinea sp.]|nr:LptF/LptG family permease [Chryseolinea sp.]
MKKIDKLILDAFIGPFLITFLVVVFILLNINMLKYFDDIIGKGLDALVLGQLFFYFAIFTVPTAMPLAVLLSSLIAFGNLGEHFELTAIKSAGISLVRILLPIFFFVLILTTLAFYANNNLVPKAALEAYSLLYDIKQKKPALELREGTFYRGIDNLSIKVNKKFPEDEQALKGVIVYDHRKNDGNKEVTIADSGRMYTILNERYLKFELYNGYNYIEGAANGRDLTSSQNRGNNESMSRSKFSKTQVVFDLSSFQLQTTDKKWFQGNRIMRNLSELKLDMDSLRREILSQRLNYYLGKPNHFVFYLRGDSVTLPPEVYRYREYRDSVSRLPHVERGSLAGTTLKQAKPTNQSDSGAIRSDSMRASREIAGRPKGKILSDSMHSRREIADRLKALTKAKESKLNSVQSPPTKKIVNTTSVIFDSMQLAKIDSMFALTPSRDVLQGAANTARQIKSQVGNSNSSLDTYEKELTVFQIQWHKILASSLACVAMFLIGAPLGAIIKKGGLGVPFLVSILFFIIYYVLTMQGEKVAKSGTIPAWVGVWIADFILFAVGLVFLRQARIDARLFESDFYAVVLEKAKRWLAERRQPRLKTT